MTVSTVIKIEVSPEELALIRSSLCNRAMKELCHAHEVQRECQEKGLADNTSWIPMDTHNKIHNIIASIDAASQ